MNYTEDKYNQAKSDMLGDFNKAILDAEDLLKAETAARERSKKAPDSVGAVPTGPIRTVEQP
jgi:hypothetical protein